MSTGTTMRVLAVTLWCVTVACLLVGSIYGSRSAAGAGSGALVLYIILAARARSLSLSARGGTQVPAPRP